LRSAAAAWLAVTAGFLGVPAIGAFSSEVETGSR